MGARQWTNEQKQCIEADGGTLLVSAAAGSGTVKPAGLAISTTRCPAFPAASAYSTGPGTATPTVQGW